MKRVHKQMMFKRGVPQTVARHIIGLVPPRTKSWCEWFTTVYAYILAQTPMSDRLTIDFDRFSVTIFRRDRAHYRIIINAPDGHVVHDTREMTNPYPGNNDYRILSLIYRLCKEFRMWSYGDQCAEMIFLRRNPSLSVRGSIERHPLSRRFLVDAPNNDALIRRLSRLEVNITNPLMVPSEEHHISMVGFLETFPESTRSELQHDD